MAARNGWRAAVLGRTHLSWQTSSIGGASDIASAGFIGGVTNMHNQQLAHGSSQWLASCYIYILIPWICQIVPICLLCVKEWLVPIKSSPPDGGFPVRGSTCMGGSHGGCNTASAWTVPMGGCINANKCCKYGSYLALCCGHWSALAGATQIRLLTTSPPA